MNKSGYKTKLSNIATVTQGQSPQSIYYSMNEGAPFLQGNRSFGNLYPTFDTFTKKITKTAKKGEVLMSVRAPVGDLNFAPCDLCIGRGLASIRANNGNHKFIYYALKYNIKNLIKQGAATTFSSVNKDIINDLDLIIPKESADREKVTSVLSSLDYKIELNNKINAELESMAKTLYDYWFLQFDFPDENGKPYKSSGGKMVWNEELKREIPEGWEVSSLYSLISKTKSGNWGNAKKTNRDDIEVFCIRGTDINFINGNEISDIPSRFINIRNKDCLLENDDLVVEISGGSPTQSTGRITLITNDVLNRFNIPLNSSNFCKGIILKNKKLSFNFYYNWAKLYENGVFFNQEGKTSGIRNLLFDSFTNSYKVAVPSEEVIDLAYSMFGLINQKKQTALIENNELIKLRNWLLPLLMNGQIRVGD